MEKAEGPIFRPKRPTSPEVIEFDEKEPNADWQRSLDFLLDHFPQIKEGKLQYLIEGGAAIILLTGSRQKTPKDIDLLVLDASLKESFQNSSKFDAKSVADWFQERGIHPSKERVERLTSTPTVVKFRGRDVYVLDRSILTFSKLANFRGRSPREDDLLDAASLGTSEEELDAIRKLMEAD